MTAVMDHETLTGVDEPTREALQAVAEAYRQAPENLKAAILAAAANGDKPADIARAISYVYTYEYVARLVRQWRAEQAGSTAPAKRKRPRASS